MRSALSWNRRRWSAGSRSATIALKPAKMVSKSAHRPSTGKLLANMQRSTPKIAIVSRTIRPLASTVHGLARLPEARDLDRDVRARRRASPSPRASRRGPSALRSARQAGVVQDDLRLRKIARQRCRLAEMPPGRLQVERQAVLLEQRVAAPPGRIAHRARRAFLHLDRVRGSRGLCRMPRTRVNAAWPASTASIARIVEPRRRRRCHGESRVAAITSASQRRLADRVGRVPLGLDDGPS